jgi:dihydrofolate synthase / folylpolyglutamate synthase
MSDVKAVNVLQDWLESFLDFERLPQKNIFWLDTIQFLCSRFNNPQNTAPCFHVAGSKGKGSVSEMIACILDAAGYTCGLYTSPHIIDFRERIGTANSFFPEPVYEAAVKEMIPRINSIIPEDLPEGRQLTWFELVTLYAFICFRQAHVDWAVYEVGMGGRLDATNVVTPRLCCITPIELEHTEYLGNTLEKIAGEKAGIIKPGIPVLIAAQQTESVRDVFRRKAQSTGSLCYFVDNLVTNLYSKYMTLYRYNNKEGYLTCGLYVHIESPLFSRPIETTLPLLGTVQAQNAALASLAVKSVFPEINEKIIETGLSHAALPGRFEIIYSPEKYPRLHELILDGAHTVNSIRGTVQTLTTLFNGSHIHLLFACAADKDVKDIASLFCGIFDKITVTRPGKTKKSDIEAEKAAFNAAGLFFSAEADYTQALPFALSQAEQAGAVLLVTGSFYLVAEVKRLLDA